MDIIHALSRASKQQSTFKSAVGKLDLTKSRPFWPHAQARARPALVTDLISFSSMMCARTTVDARLAWADRVLYTAFSYTGDYTAKSELYRALYSTCPSHRITHTQSSTAYTALYSVIQRYTALYTIQLYSLYSIQRYTITLCQPHLVPPTANAHIL